MTIYRIYALFLTLALSLTTPLLLTAATSYEVGPGKRVSIDPQHNYAIAISSATYADPAWRKVADTLRDKYNGKIHTYDAAGVTATLSSLRQQMPAYICFVGTPQECGRDFVIQVSRLTRQLDTSHPYGDAIWGIVTGYDATDAQRIASHNTPLTIRRGATSMGPGNLAHLDSGFASNEDVMTDFWVKHQGDKEVSHKQVGPDAAAALADAFNTIPIDIFYTSGHATEHDWQIAYNKPGGHFQHKDGTLYAESHARQRYPFTSPSPKLYLPVGNCLIGRIDRQDCMATSWIHSGGVHQMIGYTVVTFYGYMGWGTGMLFADGRLTLAESFYLNNQALLHKLQSEFPKVANFTPHGYDHKELGAMRQELQSLGAANAMGPLWDRDTVVLYGDPAWSASYPCTDPSFSYTVTENNGQWQLQLRILKPGGTTDPKWGVRPFLALWQKPLTQITDINCDHPLTPLITPRFILLPLTGQEEVGTTITTTFNAKSDN